MAAFDEHALKKRIEEVEKIDPEWIQFEEESQRHNREWSKLREEVRELAKQRKEAKDDDKRRDLIQKLEIKILEKDLAQAKSRKALYQRGQRTHKLERDLLVQELKGAANDELKRAIQERLEEAERAIQDYKGQVHRHESDANDCEERLGLLKKEVKSPLCDIEDYMCVARSEVCRVYLPNTSQVITNYNIDIQCVSDVTVHPKTTANEIVITPVICITSDSQKFNDDKPAIIELKKTAQLIDHNRKSNIVPLYSNTDHPNWTELGEECEMIEGQIRFKTTHFNNFVVIARFPPPTTSIVIDSMLADSVNLLTVPELPGFKVEIPPGSVKLKTAIEIKATLYYDDLEMCNKSNDLPLASACVQLAIEPPNQQFTKKIPVQIPIPGYSVIVKANPHATLQLWYTPTSPEGSSANWVLDEDTEWIQTQSDCGDCTVTILTDHFSAWGIRWSQPIADLAKFVGGIFNHVKSLSRRCQVFMTHETEVGSQINFGIWISVVPFPCEIPHNYDYCLHDSGPNLIDFKRGEQIFKMEFKEHLCAERKEFTKSHQLTEKFAAMVEFDIDLPKDAKSKLVGGLAHLSIRHKDIEEYSCFLRKQLVAEKGSKAESPKATTERRSNGEYEASSIGASINRSEGDLEAPSNEASIRSEGMHVRRYPLSSTVLVSALTVLVLTIIVPYVMHHGITKQDGTYGITSPDAMLLPKAEGNLRMSITDRPTMPALLNFPLSSGRRLNLAVEIGTEYDSFSIQLLQDDRGSVLGQIREGFGPDPQDILKEVFKRWLNGSGKPVKTWETIIEVLKDVKMLTLAESLKSELTE